MKLEIKGGVLSVSEIKELDGADSLCQQVRTALPDSVQAIEIDLSQTEFLDSGGLGELIALQKMALQQCGQASVRVLNPPPPIEQLLELTRLQRLFPILKR
jgi:anti-sigma B factor antagonist